MNANNEIAPTMIPTIDRIIAYRVNFLQPSSSPLSNFCTAYSIYDTEYIVISLTFMDKITAGIKNSKAGKERTIIA